MGYINKSYLQTQFSNFAARITAIFAKKADIPTKTSQLENDSGYKTTDNTLTNNLLATVPGTALDAVQGKVLDDKIEEVSASLVYENPLTNEASYNVSPLIKKNGLVFINKFFTGSFAKNSIITTLPEEFRPNKPYIINVLAREKGSNIGIIVLTINTNGNITLGDTSSTWDNIPINYCFPT